MDQSITTGKVVLRRIRAEKLDRYLEREEVVHHINEIKDDDRPENLTLFKNQGEHATYHNKKRKKKKGNKP